MLLRLGDALESKTFGGGGGGAGVWGNFLLFLFLCPPIPPPLPRGYRSVKTELTNVGQSGGWAILGDH